MDRQNNFCICDALGIFKELILAGHSIEDAFCTVLKEINTCKKCDKVTHNEND